MASGGILTEGLGLNGSPSLIVTRGLSPAVTVAFGPILTRGFGLNLGTAKYVPTAGFLAGPAVVIPSITGTIVWRIEASDARVDVALAGSRGPVVLSYRFERRTKLNVYQGDVTTAFVASGCRIDGRRRVSVRLIDAVFIRGVSRVGCKTCNRSRPVWHNRLVW